MSTGTDPHTIANGLTNKAPYLIPHLLDWAGVGEPQPWGAATSFALEMAHGYGLIRGESDATLTERGREVVAILQQKDQPHEQD